MVTPSIAMIPSGVKAGKVYSVLPTPVYGEELVTNGDFATDGVANTASWALGWYSNTANVSILGGKITLTNSASESNSLAYATDGVSSNNILIVNKNYKLQYKVLENNGVTSFKYYSSAGSFINAPTDLGVTHTIYIKNTSNQLFLFQNTTTNSNISLDNVSVKEVTKANADFDFTRASTATRINSQGLIETVATGVPRLDYSNGDCPSLKLEPQSTNLITYSEDFSQGYWVKGGSITVSSGYLAPDGSNNAYRVSGGGSALNAGSGLVSTTTRSIYARTESGTGTVALLSYFGNTNNLFNITEQWQRFELNSAISTGESNFYAVDFRNGTLNDVVIWGANATNDQSYATSYIPTSGTTQTRVAETCGGAGSSSSIKSEEGVLYAEISALSDDGTNRYISLSDETNSNRVVVGLSASSGTLILLVSVGGVLQVNSSLSVSLNQLANNKIAFKYKLNSFSAFINGVEVFTDNNGSVFNENTLTNLSFSNGDGGTNLYGNTNDLRVYNTALSDSELETLTSYTSFTEMANSLNYTIK
jgi:hypothetical protein